MKEADDLKTGPISTELPKRVSLNLTPEQTYWLDSCGHNPTIEAGLRKATFLRAVETPLGHFNVFMSEGIGMTQLYYILPWGGIVEKTAILFGDVDNIDEIVERQVNSMVDAIRRYAKTGELHL